MARRINLVPRSERPRTRTDWGLLLMVGLFIVVIFGLGFGYYTFSNVLDDRKQELADLEAQSAKLEQEVATLQQYGQLAAQRETVQGVVEGIYGSRTLLSNVLDAVSLVVPENAWFQSVQLTAADPIPAVASSKDAAKDSVGAINIQGTTFSFEDVSRLVVRLQLIPALANITLASAAENSPEDGVDEITRNFTIGASVVKTATNGSLPLTEVEVQDQ